MGDRASRSDLPILDELGEKLYAAAVRLDAMGDAGAGPSAVRKASRTGRRRLRRVARFRIGGLAALATVVSAGGIAAAIGLEAPAVAGRDRVLSLRQVADQSKDPFAVGVAVTERDASRLGILRDALSPANSVSPRVASEFAALVKTGVGHQRIGEIRRATGLGAGAAWVITLKGYICLFARATDGQFDAGPALGGGGCQGVAQATSRGMTFDGGGTQFHGNSFVDGLVPDSVTSVTLTLDGGGSLAVPVHDNVFLEVVHGHVHSVTYTVLGRSITTNE